MLVRCLSITRMEAPWSLAGHIEKLQNPNGSAWARIDAAQRSVFLPCLLVPQPAHAVLAGELAAALLPEGFGPLPPEIVRAIQMHDTGWAGSDAQQIQRLRAGDGKAAKANPVSFVAIAPGEAAEAWTASIDSVETFSKAGACVVSRHFCLLARSEDRDHRQFLKEEQTRQIRLAGSADPAELDRWTAAVGFCDLVSLYLLCGFGGPMEFPLAHPASRQAGSTQASPAPCVRMDLDGLSLRFVPEILRPGSVLSIQGLVHPAPSRGPRAETLTWEVS